MNLHAVASGAIGAVNPNVTGTITPSTGYTVVNFVQTPAYGTPVTALMQVQALTSRDLQQIESLNIQGNLRKVFLNGQWNGINRPQVKGGDLLSVLGATWKIFQVNQWPDWSELFVVQTDSSGG